MAMKIDASRIGRDEQDIANLLCLKPGQGLGEFAVAGLG